MIWDSKYCSNPMAWALERMLTVRTFLRGRLVILGALLAIPVTLAAPNLSAQTSAADTSFVGQLDAIEGRIIQGNQNIAQLRKRAKSASAALRRDAAPFDTAQRARKKVRTQVLEQLIAWDKAHRSGERAPRYLPPGQSEDTQMLLAAAQSEALSARVDDIDVLQIIDLDVRRTREGVAQRAGMGVEIAQENATVKAAEKTREYLVDKANSDAHKKQVEREVKDAENKLENSLGMLLKNSTERDFHRLKGTLRPPVSETVTAGYGPRKQAKSMSYVRHTGLTWKLDEGTQVNSVAAGLVVFAGRMEGFGEMVIIDHGQKYHSVYAHLKSLDVKVGDTVKRGASIAKSGQTGSFDGPKLYFELRKNGHPINPSAWFIQP